MTDVLDENDIRQELCILLRNSDVISTTERGVTTTTATTTFVSDSNYLINKNNIRNIRSLTIGGTAYSVGDYTTDYYYNDSGTRKCKVNFVSSVTGTATITYDYGDEKIYPDYPRVDMNLSNYPRVGIGIVDIPTKPIGFGNNNVSNIDIEIRTLDSSNGNVNDIIKLIRTAIIDNQNNLYYLPVVKPVRTGPTIPVEGKNKLFTKSFDIRGSFVIEKN